MENFPDLGEQEMLCLNQQLSSTEFEVRLHSYTVIHPTTTTNSLLLLLAAQLARQADCTTVQSQALCTTIDSSNVPHRQTVQLYSQRT